VRGPVEPSAALHVHICVIVVGRSFRLVRHSVAVFLKTAVLTLSWSLIGTDTQSTSTGRRGLVQRISTLARLHGSA
jgi:hypothetical protein